ncbi:MAG: DNA-directed RNA polymerase subunit beta, partial [Oscillospiraceae bacterium]|nr:DNA-directed RNA polymerase subunit beta [Oscillospiraceae bacterium]
MPQDVLYGKTLRKSFAQTQDIVEMPSLLEVQKTSYRWFLENGLREVFKDVASITDYSGNLELSFIDYSMDEAPKYSVEECKARDATYAAPLKVSVRLRNKETEEIKEQEIFMGDFPLMTDGGTFIINGAERVIVSQIIRSPGAYYSIQTDKSADSIYSATVIPYRGAWLEYETDASGVFYVRIDKNRKLPVTWLLRAMGQQIEDKPYTWNTAAESATGGNAVSTENLKAIFGEDERLLATLEKDPTGSREEALLEIYRKLRPGDPPTVDSAEVLLENLFFDPRRYDISAVGRYKFNKKLALATRLNGQELFYPIADPLTGEILAEAGEVLTRERAQELEKRGVIEATIKVDEQAVKLFSNGMVPLTTFVDCQPKELGIHERVRWIVLKRLMAEHEGAELLEAIRENADILVPKHIIVDDIYATVNYLMGLGHGIGNPDDIDHLGNRRMRSVGELLQNQFRVGFSRMERVIRERMTLQDLDIVTPQSLINIRPVTAAIKEFFGSSPLSQFMDQTNPMSELTHKRRMSA